MITLLAYKMTGTLIESLGKMLVPVVVYGVFALARKYLPASALKKPTTHVEPVTVLDARFRGTQWLFGVAMITTGAVFAITSYAVLMKLNQYFAAMEGPAFFQLLPQNAIWWFFPGFGALSLAWELTLVGWARLGSFEKAETYSYWSNQRAGFDCRTVLRWMAIGIGLPIGVATILALPMHTTLHETEMRIRGYASISSSRYKYTDVRRLTVVHGIRYRDGTFRDRAAIVLDFADGRRWSSADNRDWVKIADAALTGFIQQKTGLALEYALTPSDIPQTASTKQ